MTATTATEARPEDQVTGSASWGGDVASRKEQIALAIAGSMAFQGPVVRWVADHPKHHKLSDRDGDPHSPWHYGTDRVALTKGLGYAHMMWLFNPEQTPQRKYAPDLMKDRDIVRISRQFPMWVVVSLVAPTVAGGLVTWSINSICHAIGDRPFVSRDKSANVWWLAIPSMGEYWHDLHHADPTCARHGVLRGQLDTSTRVIWAMERVGWVEDVRWPVKNQTSIAA